MPTAALVLLAVGTGALLSAQGPVLTRLAEFVGGPLQAGATAFAIGFAVLIGLCLVSGSGAPAASGLLRMPLWVWLAGTIGAAVIVVTVLVVPRLGVAPFVAAVIFGQLTGALIIDHIGGFGLDVRRVGPRELIGVALLFAGAVMVAGDADG